MVPQTMQIYAEECLFDILSYSILEGDRTQYFELHPPAVNHVAVDFSTANPPAALPAPCAAPPAPSAASQKEEPPLVQLVELPHVAEAHVADINSGLFLLPEA